MPTWVTGAWNLFRLLHREGDWGIQGILLFEKEIFNHRPGFKKFARIKGANIVIDGYDLKSIGPWPIIFKPLCDSPPFCLLSVFAAHTPGHLMMGRIPSPF